MDWDEITTQLEAAVLAAFDALIASLQGQGLYALALVTEDGSMSVGIAANTEEAFQEHLKAEREVEGELSPQDEAGYRWNTGEWLHEGWRNDLFAALNRVLCDEAVGEETDNVGGHLAKLVETMTAALARLRREREAMLADTILFVTLTDSDEAEGIEDASAQQVNPPMLLDHFLKRYD